MMAFTKGDKEFIESALTRTQQHFESALTRTQQHFESALTRTQQYFDTALLSTLRHFETVLTRTQQHFETALLSTQRYLETRMDQQHTEVLGAIDSLKTQETEDVVAAYLDVEKLEKRVTQIEEGLKISNR